LMRNATGGTAVGAFNRNGDGVAVWTATGGVQYSRYSITSDSWSTPTTFSSVASAFPGVPIAIDNAGNVVTSFWTVGNPNILYAGVLTGSTWNVAQLSNGLDLVGGGTVAINSGRPVIMWGQGTGTFYTRYSSRFEQGAWTTRQSIDFNNTAPYPGPIAEDGNGNVVAI